MSGVKCRPEVVQAQIIKVQNIAESVKTIGQILETISSSFQPKTQAIVTSVLKNTGSLSIPSLIMASSEINKKSNILKSNALEIAKYKEIAPLKAEKIAAIATLSNYMVKDSPMLTRSISNILSSTTKESVAHAIHQTRTIAQVQHRSVFVENLAKTCSTISVSMGFTEVTTKLSSNDVMRVISTSKNGTKLITDIEIVADKSEENVNMTTETFGFSEKESTVLQNTFSQGLKDYGVVYQGKYQCKTERLYEQGLIKTPSVKKKIKAPQIFNYDASISSSSDVELERIKNLKF